VVQGCTYPWACNFDPLANDDNGSCSLDECAGCTYPMATNFSVAATHDDGSCVFEDVSCPEDIDGDSAITTTDLLLLLSSFGGQCSP
jgi:hypothetical protein